MAPTPEAHNEELETAPLTVAEDTGAVAEQTSRPRVLVIVLAVVIAVLMVAPLSMLALEIEHSRIKLSAATRRVRSSLDGIDCAVHDAATHHDSCIAPLLALGEFQGHATVLYADEIFQIDWSEVVTRADVLHLAALQRACTAHDESVIPWHFGHNGGAETTTLMDFSDDDQRLLDALRQCPSFDVYIPSSIRGQGYCEDAAAYTKYGHARMLPQWVFEVELYDKTLDRNVTYHELCPRTPVLMMNHYWDGLRDEPTWPRTKPLFLMPNIEMFELAADHLWQADAVLCKTVVCAEYVTKWFEQQGNPRLARVLYTRHTTSDVATSALVATGRETLESAWSRQARTPYKDFESPTFVHTAGSSTQKGTAHVLDCWLSRPDLPTLDVYMNEGLYNRLFHKTYDARLRGDSDGQPAPTNLRLHLGGLSADAFGMVVANASAFLCTSRMEGYGHYLNQARASGGLVLAPDVAPMNELVTPASGVLVAARRDAWARHFLGGASKDALGLRNVTGFVARFGGTDVCAAVDAALTRMDARERASRGERARQQYLYDTAFFARAMRRLRETLPRAHGDHPAD